MAATNAFTEASAGVIPLGPLDGTVWLEVSGGHVTVMERLSAATLKPLPPSCNDGLVDLPACSPTYGGAGIGDGTLWIAPNDCVGPLSDKVLGAAPAPVGASIMGVGDQDVFIESTQPDEPSQTTQTVQAFPIAAACRQA